MIWPYARLTTYQAGLPPAIKKDDLNAMQDALIVPAPTAQVIGVNTPQEFFRDAGANGRSLIDHNGFRMGRVNECIEDWAYAIGDFALGANKILGHGTDNLIPRWTGSTGAGSIINNRGPNSTYWASGVKMQPGNEYMNLYSSQAPFFAGDNVSFVLELELLITTLSANFTLVRLGMTNSTANFAVANTAEVYLYFANPATAWQIAHNSSTGGGGTFSGAIAGHGPTANVWQRARLEFHGKNTPYGVAANPDGAATGAANAAKVRAFLDDVWVYTSSTTVPNQGLRFFFDVTGTNSGDTVQLGPVKWAFNRWLSVPGL